MTRWLGVFTLGLVISFAVKAADDVAVPVGKFLKQFAHDNDIELVGFSAIGSDTFTPFNKQVSVDRTLARALSHYSYIVNYGENRIVRVVILGRKGASVGDMPDDTPPSLVPDDEPQREQDSPPE